jgi:hypothetical protein
MTYEQSITGVLKSTIQDAQDLVRSEVALAKAELRDEMKRAGAGIAALAAAAVAALIAVVFLFTAIAWAMFEGLGWPVWTGFALVTVVVGLAAVVLAYMGRRRLAGERRMRLTVDSMKENMQWMRARTS